MNLRQLMERMGFVNALDRGCKGDGSTDDGPALTALHTWAQEQQKCIWTPPTANGYGIGTPVTYKVPMFGGATTTDLTGDINPGSGTSRWNEGRVAKFLNVGINDTSRGMFEVSPATFIVAGDSADARNGFFLSQMYLSCGLSGGKSCQGILADGDNLGPAGKRRWLSMYMLDRVIIKDVYKAATIDAFVGWLYYSQLGWNTRDGFTLKTCNAVHVIGGHYSIPTSDPSRTYAAQTADPGSYMFRLKRASNSNTARSQVFTFKGVTLEGGSTVDDGSGHVPVSGSGICVEAGVDNVTLDNSYMEVGCGGILLDVAPGSSDVASDRVNDLTIIGGNYTALDYAGGQTYANPSIVRVNNVRRLKALGNPQFNCPVELRNVRDASGFLTHVAWNQEHTPNATSTLGDFATLRPSVGKPENWIANPHMVAPAGATSFGGYSGLVLNGGVLTVDTTVVRHGKSALRLTKAAGATWENVQFLPYNQSLLATYLKGRRLYAAAWVYVPSGVGTYGQVNGNSPIFGIHYYDGGVRQSQDCQLNAKAVRTGAWNFLWASIDVPSGAGTITSVAAYLYPMPGNGGDTLSSPAQYVVADGVFVGLDVPDIEAVARGDWVTHPLAACRMEGTQMVYEGTAVPTGTGVYYGVWDRVIHTAPVAGGSLGWVCTTAGVAGAATWKEYGLIEA
jgi:hypothetical protein